MSPPGPFRPRFWRSPLRGPWLTAALGSVLLVLVAVVATTGFLSHVAYQPDLPGNAIVDRGADLPLSFAWPAGFALSTRSPRACTSTSASSRSRSCWPSCGR